MLAWNTKRLGTHGGRLVAVLRHCRDAQAAPAPAALYEVVQRRRRARPMRVPARPSRAVTALGRPPRPDAPAGRSSSAAPDGRRSTLRPRGTGRLRALAADRQSGAVQVLGTRAVLTVGRGRVLRRASLRGIGLERPSALAIAPTGDPTDPPARRGLYVADGRRVVELAFASSARALSAVTEVSAAYVQAISTSAFSPSSPDPAGIVYDPAADRFITADSEVEEMPLYGAPTC